MFQVGLVFGFWGWNGVGCAVCNLPGMRIYRKDNEPVSHSWGMIVHIRSGLLFIFEPSDNGLGRATGGKSFVSHIMSR